MTLVIAGIALAVLNLVADAAAAAWTWWAVRVEDPPGTPQPLDYLMVRSLLGLTLLLATVWSLHATLRRSDVARVRLAVLLLATAPLVLGGLAPTAYLYVTIKIKVWQVVRMPGWVPVGLVVSLASGLLLAMLSVAAAALLTRPAARGHTDTTPAVPPTSRPSASLTAAVDTVRIGVAVAILNLVAEATAGWLLWLHPGSPLADDPIVSGLLLGYLLVRALLGVGLTAGVLTLLAQTRRGLPAGQAGLATLMFCCVPLCALSAAYTSVLLIYRRHVLGDTTDTSLILTHISLYVSLATAAGLVLVALLAGALLTHARRVRVHPGSLRP